MVSIILLLMVIWIENLAGVMPVLLLSWVLSIEPNLKEYWETRCQVPKLICLI